MPRSIPPTKRQLDKQQQKLPYKKPFKLDPKFRLPSGTSFTCTYDGVEEKWTVRLAVPGGGIYTAKEPSIHYALRKLGKAWYKQHGKKKEAADGGANRPVA